MSDSKKTRKQLIEELEQLRGQVAQRQQSQSDNSAPALAGDVSRRTALKVAWTAPVILAIPLQADRSGAQPPVGTVAPGCPTMTPTNAAPPTSSPTLFPTTAEPTISPTQPVPTTRLPTSSPTNDPTLRPTTSPTIPAPTAMPTARPTTSPTIPAPTLSPTPGFPTLSP